MEFDSSNILKAMQKMIDLLASIKANTDQSSFFSEQLVGAFWGAFFVFLFFIIGNWIWDSIKRRIDWKKKNRLEHAYLERYFGELSQIIRRNKSLLSAIVNDYKNKRLSHLKFVLLPIREDVTMKISDQILINRFEMYVSNLKSINADLNNLNVFKDKINNDLVDVSKEVKKRGQGFLGDYLEQLQGFGDIFDYNLSEVEEFIAENKILLKKYKNWKYDELKFKKDYEERRIQIKDEMEVIRSENAKNPMQNDYLKKLEKFDLYKPDSSSKGIRPE